MNKELKRTVKFHVEIYDPRQGTIWTQEFIKPLVNYISNTTSGVEILKNGEDAGKGVMVGVYDLFNDEVIQTLNTFSCEDGRGYEQTMNDVRSEKLNVYIGVTPEDDYHNDGHRDGYFDFYNDRGNNTEVYTEVKEILASRMMKIRKDDGYNFFPIVKKCA